MVFHILLISRVLVLQCACDHVHRQQTEQPKYDSKFLRDFISAPNRSGVDLPLALICVLAAGFALRVNIQTVSISIFRFLEITYSCSVVGAKGYSILTLRHCCRVTKFKVISSS